MHPFAVRSFAAAAALALLAAAPAAFAQAPAASPPPIDSMRAELIRNFSADQRNVWRYSHRERVALAKNGRVTRRRLLVYFVNGHQVTITLANNGQPLTAAQLEDERHAAQARAAELRHRPPPPAGSLIFNGRAYSFAKLANDFLYAPGRVDRWQDRTVWIYAATPNPNTPSRSREEQVLLGSKGEIWVDAQDHHVVRITLHTFEPVKYFLGILATVHSAHLDLQLARRTPGEWLPARTDFAFDASILLFKRLREAKTQNFSDFQLRSPNAAPPSDLAAAMP